VLPCRGIDDDAMAITLQPISQLVEASEVEIVSERIQDCRQRRGPVKDRGARLDEDGERSPIVGLLLDCRKPRSFQRSCRQMVAFVCHRVAM
jgi:hypothetical protein